MGAPRVLRLGFLCGASQESMLCDFAYACLWSFQGLTWLWASLSLVPSGSLGILGTLFLGPHFILLTPPQEQGYYDIQFVILEAVLHQKCQTTPSLKVLSLHP